MVQNFRKTKQFLTLLTFVGSPLFATQLSVTSTGSAEADPDLYLYNIRISASCFDTDAAVEDKVTDLEEKLSQMVTPFLIHEIQSENQFYTTSSELPEQNDQPTTTYVRGANEEKITCSAGKWNYSSSAVVKLHDVKVRKEFQKALTKLSAENSQLNPELSVDKKVWSISVSSAQPNLTPGTKKQLFAKAYEDASKSAKAKVKAILVTESPSETNFKLLSATENPEEDYGGRSYALESSARSLDGDTVKPGIQKLKLSVSYRFNFETVE